MSTIRNETDKKNDNFRWFRELKSDPKRTKSTELEIQNRALLGELERQKVERLNHIQQKYEN